MMGRSKTKEELVREIAELRRQLDELRASVRQPLAPDASPAAPALEGAQPPFDRRQQEIEAAELMAFLEHARVALYKLGPDGTVLWANRSYAELLGYAPAELIGTHIAELHTDGSLVHELLQRLARAEPLRAYQARFRCKDGTTRAVVIDSRPYRQEDGPAHTLCLVQDITERRQAEAALQSELALRQAIEESLLVGLASIDLAGRQTYVSPAFCRMVGWSEQELVGATPPFAYWPPEAVEQLTAALQTVLSGAAPAAGLELRFRRRNEQRFDVRLIVSPIRGERGATTGWMASISDITEQKRAELALQESERTVRLITENISEVIYAYSMDHQLLYVNPAVEQLTGYSAADLRQQQFINWIHPKDESRVIPLWQGLFAGDEFTDEEFRIVTRSGQVKWLLSTWKPLYNETGEQIGVIGHDRDITERKYAEESLRFLANASAILSSSLDYETTFVSLANLCVPSFADWCIVDILEDDRSFRRVAVTAADPRKLELLRELQQHYPPHWNAPQPAVQVLRTAKPLLLSTVGPDDMRKYTQDERHYELVRQLGPCSSVIVPLIAREHILGVLTFVTGESGRVYRPTDLTLAEELARRAALAIDNARLYKSARQANEESRRQAERLHILAEASHAFTAASLDLDSRLNAVASHIADLIGDSCLIRLLSADRQWLLPVALYDKDPEVLAIVRQLLASAPQRADEGLTGRIVQSGQPFLLPKVEKEQLRAFVKPEYSVYLDRVNIHSLILVPLRLPDRVIGSLGLARHSNSPPYSADDLALVQDLADRAALAIDNARLYREVKETLQLRDQFLSLAAHELKTPMTTIMGVAQLLQRRMKVGASMTDRDAHSLRILTDQVRRLYRLINSLLDLGHLQDGRFGIEHAALDLAALIRQLVDEFEPALGQHKLELALPERACMITGDRLRLEQVFQNLLHNALKYSPNGGTIRVVLEPREREMRVTISDEGIGIPRQDQAKIFERFYRARNVNEQQVSGMGVGLYVVKEIIAQHGGTVTIESTEGQGTTVIVSLPTLKQHPLPVPRNEQPAE